MKYNHLCCTDHHIKSYQAAPEETQPDDDDDDVDFKGVQTFVAR